MDTLKLYASQLWRSSDTKSSSTEVSPAIQNSSSDNLAKSIDNKSSTWSGYLCYLPRSSYLGISGTKTSSTEAPSAVENPSSDNLTQSVDSKTSTWSGYLHFLPSLPYLGRINMDETNDSSKLWRLMKEAPFVPIGLVGMVGVCVLGAYKYKNRGGMSSSLYLMRLRIAAQGAVVGCMILGLAGSLINDYIMHPDKGKK